MKSFSCIASYDSLLILSLAITSLKHCLTFCLELSRYSASLLSILSTFSLNCSIVITTSPSSFSTISLLSVFTILRLYYMEFLSYYHLALVYVLDYYILNHLMIHSHLQTSSLHISYTQYISLSMLFSDSVILF